MSEQDLTAPELTSLIERVFRPRPEDRGLAILIDLPDEGLADNPEWYQRRRRAAGWARELSAARDLHRLEVTLVCYRNVKSNNADLPATGWCLDPERVPDDTRDPGAGRTVQLADVLAAHQLVLAPTELSATAPLKMLAPRLGFRAATMPGFSAAMLPALRLDYTEIDRRVR